MIVIDVAIVISQDAWQIYHETKYVRDNHTLVIMDRKQTADFNLFVAHMMKVDLSDVQKVSYTRVSPFLFI